MKRFRPHTATTVLLGALVVQIFDMGSTAAVTHDALRDSEAQLLNRGAWTLLLSEHSLVRATPHECVVGSGARAFASRELQRIASQTGVPITTVAAARQHYGVVINDSNLDVDNKATAQLRGRLRTKKKEVG